MRDGATVGVVTTTAQADLPAFQDSIRLSPAEVVGCGICSVLGWWRIWGR